MCMYAIKQLNMKEEIIETMDKKNDVLLYFISLFIYIVKILYLILK